MPLTQWSDDDLGDLIGRKEGQLLEAKGPEIDLSRPEDRRKLARETAGLASTMGGILVIGAAETGGVVTALPGIADAGDAESRLRNALRDLVTPLPHIQTRSFVVTPETSVIVVEVLPDPAGRPVMVSGDGFWMRAEDARCACHTPTLSCGSNTLPTDSRGHPSERKSFSPAYDLRSSLPTKCPWE